jgi:large subunit GTPase 1
VIEKSDMAVQIVDARNPLLFYTSDLMTYAAEQKPKKPIMLVVNKADYLTDYQVNHRPELLYKYLDQYRLFLSFLLY